MSFVRNSLFGLALAGGALFVGHKEGYVSSHYIDPAEDSVFRFGKMPCDQKKPMPTKEITGKSIAALLHQCGTLTWCETGVPLSLDNQTFFDVCLDADRAVTVMPELDEKNITVEFSLRAVLASGQSIPTNTWYAIDSNLELDRTVLLKALSDGQNKKLCVDEYIKPLQESASHDLDTLLEGKPNVIVVAQHGATICDEPAGLPSIHDGRAR